MRGGEAAAGLLAARAGPGEPHLDSALLPSDSCHLGTYSLLSVTRTLVPERELRDQRLGHPDTVPMNPRPLCYMCSAFLGLHSKLRKSHRVKTRGDPTVPPSEQKPDPPPQRLGRTLPAISWKQVNSLMWTSSCVLRSKGRSSEMQAKQMMEQSGCHPPVTQLDDKLKPTK